MMPEEGKMAQLHSVHGTKRFLYRKYSVSVNVVTLDPKDTFVESHNQNKVAARLTWAALVRHGWSTKRIET